VWLNKYLSQHFFITFEGISRGFSRTFGQNLHHEQKNLDDPIIARPACLLVSAAH
jgi:hypothetical protein